MREFYDFIMIAKDIILSVMCFAPAVLYHIVKWYECVEQQNTKKGDAE